MHRVKLILFAACLATLPAFAFFGQDPFAPQEKKPEKPAPAGASARVSFGALTYTEAGGQAVTVAAKNLLEVRMITSPYDGVRLELLYQNGDYSLIKPTAFHVVRRVEAGAYEVLVSRVDATGMAFPFVN